MEQNIQSNGDKAWKTSQNIILWIFFMSPPLSITHRTSKDLISYTIYLVISYRVPYSFPFSPKRQLGIHRFDQEFSSLVRTTSLAAMLRYQCLPHRPKLLQVQGIGKLTKTHPFLRSH